MNILCIGEEWRGSNASAFFYALSRAGHSVNLVNELTFVSLKAISIRTRFLNRLVRAFQVNDFNRHLMRSAKAFKPDLVLVYKGAFILEETLFFWKRLGLPVVNFFPDVSFLAHGKHIPASIPHYDHIFTTKTFAAADLARNFNYRIEDVSFIPHGFDPMVHRPMENKSSPFKCDASFIGSFSPHKESYLIELKRKNPSLNLKIWGENWPKVSNKIDDAIQSISVVGDLYTQALNSSIINLALLSERVKGASRGDQITSRTFHIPGSGGFMLHQRTNELLQYFEEGLEVACFESKEEFIDKTKYYLANETQRETIRKNGQERAWKDHTIDQRASQVIKILKDKNFVS